MIVNWFSRQQYFGSYIITWDAAYAFAIPPPGIGTPLKKHIFMADRKRALFEAQKKDQYFVSKRDRLR